MILLVLDIDRRTNPHLRHPSKLALVCAAKTHTPLWFLQGLQWQGKRSLCRAITRAKQPSVSWRLRKLTIQRTNFLTKILPLVVWSVRLTAAPQDRSGRCLRASVIAPPRHRNAVGTSSFPRIAKLVCAKKSVHSPVWFKTLVLVDVSVIRTD